MLPSGEPQTPWLSKLLLLLCLAVCVQEPRVVGASAVQSPYRRTTQRLHGASCSPSDDDIYDPCRLVGVKSIISK